MKKIFLMFFIVFPFLSFAQPRSSAEIITDLRNNINTLKELNSEKENIIIDSKKTIKELKEDNLKLITEVEKDVELREELNKTIVKQDAKIKQQNKDLEKQRKQLVYINCFLSGIIVLHLIIFFINIRFKIKLPYWLNTLL